MSDSILLGAVAARTPEIRIACRTCPRRGRLRTDKLLLQYGPDMPIPELLRILAADCPQLAAAATVYRRCDVHCPTLPELFSVGSGGP